MSIKSIRFSDFKSQLFSHSVVVFPSLLEKDFIIKIDNKNYLVMGSEKDCMLFNHYYVLCYDFDSHDFVNKIIHSKTKIEVIGKLENVTLRNGFISALADFLLKTRWVD